MESPSSNLSALPMPAKTNVVAAITRPHVHSLSAFMSSSHFVVSGDNAPSDIALLSRLFVAWVCDGIDDYRDKENEAFYDVLRSKRHVEDGHPVEQSSHEQRSDYDVADAAVSPTQADSANHHDQN